MLLVPATPDTPVEGGSLPRCLGLTWTSSPGGLGVELFRPLLRGHRRAGCGSSDGGAMGSGNIEELAKRWEMDDLCHPGQS